MYFFHLPRNTHDTPDIERDCRVLGEMIVDVTQRLFISRTWVTLKVLSLIVNGRFRDKFNQFSMVNGN